MIRYGIGLAKGEEIGKVVIGGGKFVHAGGCAVCGMTVEYGESMAGCGYRVWFDCTVGCE